MNLNIRARKEIRRKRGRGKNGGVEITGRYFVAKRLHHQNTDAASGLK